MDPSKIFTIVGNASYVALAAVALWGAYFVVLVMSRVSRKRFKSEELQDSFLASIEPDLRKGRFEQVIAFKETSWQTSITTPLGLLR